MRYFSLHELVESSSFMAKKASIVTLQKKHYTAMFAGLLIRPEQIWWVAYATK